MFWIFYENDLIIIIDYILVAEQCLHTQEFFCFSCCPASEDAGFVQGGVRGQDQDS